jgi:ribosome modulation factor
MTLVLDAKAWQAGFDAGAAGHSDECPYGGALYPVRDWLASLSWSSGWIAGDEARRASNGSCDAPSTPE